VGAFFSGFSNAILKIKHIARHIGGEFSRVLECGSGRFTCSLCSCRQISFIFIEDRSRRSFGSCECGTFSGLMTSSHSTVILSPYRQNLIQRSPSEVKEKSPSSAFEKHLHPVLDKVFLRISSLPFFQS
jgi:hypothetical protein